MRLNGAVDDERYWNYIFRFPRTVRHRIYNAILSFQKQCCTYSMHIHLINTHIESASHSTETELIEEISASVQ